MLIIRKPEKNYKQVQQFLIIVHFVAGFDRKGNNGVMIIKKYNV